MIIKRGKLTRQQLLTLQDGPSLSPGDLSRLLHGSPSEYKIRDDIHANKLRAVPQESSSGKSHRLMIPFRDAQAYVRKLRPDENTSGQQG